MDCRAIVLKPIVNYMCRKNESYERFAEFLENWTGEKRLIPDFKEICVRVGASEKEVSDFIRREFDLSGEQVVTSYRTSTPIQFL